MPQVPPTFGEMATALDCSERHVKRLINKGMPRHSLDAALAWKSAPRVKPPHMQVGHVKPIRRDGELSATELASVLGVSVPRIHQLWNAGMPRSSVADVLVWRKRQSRVPVDAGGSSSPADSDSSGGFSGNSSSDSDDSLKLYVRSRNLSGPHSVCPQLLDFCLAGIACWGKFYKQFRPFKFRSNQRC